MRYNEQAVQPSKEKKVEKPRELPKAGRYTLSDIQAKGVKSGIWEKKGG